MSCGACSIPDCLSDSGSIGTPPGFVLGHGAARLCADPALRGIIVTACTFSNVIGLPLPLMTAVLECLPSAPPGAIPRAISLLFLCNLPNSAFFWVLAPRMVRGSAAGKAGASYTLVATAEPIASSVDKGEVAPARRLRCARARGRLQLPANTVSAVLLSVAVVLSPIRDWLVPAAHAPLGPLWGAMNMLGAAALPLVLLVLAGTLVGGTASGSSNMDPFSLAVAVCTKLVAVPLCNMISIIAARAIGLLPPDPVLLMSLCVAGTAQSAASLSIVAGMEGCWQRETAMLQFWQLLCAPLTLSAFTSMGLAFFWDASQGVSNSTMV